MKSVLSLCNIVYWLALACWVGAIMAGGIAAPNVFGTLDSLDLRLADFAQFDPSAHPRIAGGMIMERVFWIGDCIQFVAAPLLVVCLIVQLLGRPFPSRKVSNAIRSLAIVAALGTLAWQATMLSPAMNRDLRAFWAAAKAGDAIEAQAHRASFDTAHPVASGLVQSRLGLLLIALAASAIALSPQLPRASTSLEAPNLIRKR